MNIRLTAFSAVLITCATPAWAATSNVDMYGVLDISVDPVSLPTHETYSAAADVSTNIFSHDSTYTPLWDVTSTSGVTAQINGAGYTASASTTLGSTHAYASASAMPSNVLNTGGFSGWYDHVTIAGGTGTGTAYFTVQLAGTVDVGAFGGSLGYTLGTSSIHPSLLADSINIVDTAMSPTYPWSLQASSATTITSYLLGASPYNDTSILFPTTSTDPLGGIPSITDPIDPLGGDTGMGFPTPDRILTPRAGQSVDITLQGTLTFTYGEAFYLIGGLGVTVFGDGLESFCAFPSTIGDTCAAPVKDGTGATTLDFSNSANLVSIALPEGATASFASGATYTVTTVPEPTEWLMLLAGLGLVGWRARRKTA